MTTKEKILEEFEKEFKVKFNKNFYPDDLDFIEYQKNIQNFLSQALDKVAEETRKETLADVVILIDRYAKENSEEVSNPDEVLEPAKR
jgi:hypothetical protein